mmetsp:Transcript_103157/g.295968  ORF Transcript_103157/g.295968 Transcript_103157/m.295968 type:complete len:228 (+) Transcript_103157:1003-1686(+)
MATRGSFFPWMQSRRDMLRTRLSSLSSGRRANTAGLAGWFHSSTATRVREAPSQVWVCISKTTTSLIFGGVTTSRRRRWGYMMGGSSTWSRGTATRARTTWKAVAWAPIRPTTSNMVCRGALPSCWAASCASSAVRNTSHSTAGYPRLSSTTVPKEKRRSTMAAVAAAAAAAVVVAAVAAQRRRRRRCRPQSATWSSKIQFGTLASLWVAPRAMKPTRGDSTATTAS